jgi:cytochrome o ubiquinol oxidase operon protein cyoD
MKRAPGTIASYTTGFVLSILLTLVAYFLVTHHITSGLQSPSPQLVLASIAGLAVLQLYVQVRYFLHLGAESGPRWKLMAFLFMLMVVVIVVFGSLWIMHNLNYHSMTPTQLKSYMQTNEGL